MNAQKFCLKWDHFRTSVTSVFNNLRQDEELVDITLCCEGQKIKAHRMMLSACSPYFRDLLKENPCQHPVFFLKDTSIEDLRAVVEFVYKGEVNVAQAQLGSFIKTAEMLQVRGLSGDDDDTVYGPPLPAASRLPPSTPSFTAAERRASAPTQGRPADAARSPPAKRRRSGSPRLGSPRLSASPSPCGSPARLDPPLPSKHEPPPLPPLPLPLPPPVPVPALPVADSPDIKVERVDLADDDCLEAALGRVASYEDGPGGLADRGLLAAGAGDESLGEAGPSAAISGNTSVQGFDRPQLAEVNAAGRLVCVICGKTYRSRDSFRHHVETHTGKATCPHCGQTFATSSNRIRHAAICSKRLPNAAGSSGQLTNSGQPVCPSNADSPSVGWALYNRMS